LPFRRKYIWTVLSHVLTNTYLHSKRGREIENEREAKKEKEIEVKQERKGKQPRYEREGGRE
jgi:hypothetical protein